MTMEPQPPAAPAAPEDEQVSPDVLAMLLEYLELERRQTIARLKLIDRLVTLAKGRVSA